MSKASHSLADDLSYCASVTRGGGSNLWFVSKMLPSAKKPLFAASYASMRFIDDLIDDDFLTMSQKDREEHREAYIRHIDDWELKSVGLRAADNKAEDAIYRALAETVCLSNLGTAPWHNLAMAMKRDVNEEPIQDWDDFDRYSVGATVSPAVVYLYILLANQKPDGVFHGPSSEQLYPMAQDMAIFCYLVHIMRDIAKDAAGCAQLLTIPYSLRDQLLAGSLPGNSLIAEIAEKAERHRRKMAPYVSHLSDDMPWAERKCFKALLAIYGKLFSNICRDPSCVFQEDPNELDEMCREKAEA